MTYDARFESLTCCHDTYKADEVKTDAQKTEEILKQITNSTCQDLRFTSESQDDFEDKKLPTLDFSLKRLKDKDMTKISFEFYKKPMASKFGKCQNSALSTQIKSGD